MQASTDNRYQKTFRSFKRLKVKGCTPAEPTTTAEPMCTPPNPYSSDINECAAAFDDDLAEYFRDTSDCEDCVNPMTGDVSAWPQLPTCVTQLPNIGSVAGLALSTDIADYGEPKNDGTDCWHQPGCMLCDGVHGSCFGNAAIGLNTWCTSGLTSFAGAFSRMDSFNQVSSALN